MLKYSAWHASTGLRPKTRAFVRLLIMTAAREDEVANIAAGEVDLMRGRWTLPAARTKNRHELIVPLHPLLIEELRTIWPKTPVHAGYRLLGATKAAGSADFRN